MAFKLRKIGGVIPAHAPIAEQLNPIIANINRGHVVDSDTVRAVRLPDGRIQLLLKQPAQGAALPTGPISGCTDPAAANYNPLATIDNGSCQYSCSTACPPTHCYMAAQVRIAQEEIDVGTVSGDFISLERDASFGSSYFGIYIDYGNNQWVAYGPDGEARISFNRAALPNSVHCISLSINSAQAILCVDGLTASWSPQAQSEAADVFLAGSYIASGTASHRTIKNFTAVSAGVVLFAAPAGFDTSNGAISYSDGVLRIDATGDAWGRKNLSPAFDPICCPVEVFLACDTLSASLTKCGYSPFAIRGCTFGDPITGYSDYRHFTGCSSEFFDCSDAGGDPVDQNKLFLTIITEMTGTAPSEGESCDCDCPMEGTTTSTCTVDPFRCPECGIFENPAECASDCFSEGEIICSPGFCGCCFCRDTNVTCSEDHPPCDGDCLPLFSHPVVGSQSLSNEYTTDMLIMNAEAYMAALVVTPGYDDSFNDSPCVATRDLSEDENTYTLQRLKYKFFWTPGVSTYFKIFWTERFTPKNGDPLVNTEMSWEHAAGTSVSESDVFEVLEPDTEGTTSIINVHWTNIAGTEPPTLFGCDPSAGGECSYDNCQ